MPNNIITADKAAKCFMESAIKVIKEVSPNLDGQQEELNLHQEIILRLVLNAFSRQMFYGRSPMGN